MVPVVLGSGSCEVLYRPQGELAQMLAEVPEQEGPGVVKISCEEFSFLKEDHSRNVLTFAKYQSMARIKMAKGSRRQRSTGRG